jgi:hypothetical protein
MILTAINQGSSINININKIIIINNNNTVE